MQKLVEILAEVHEVTQWNFRLFTFVHLYFLNFQEKDIFADLSGYLYISTDWPFIHIEGQGWYIDLVNRQVTIT